MLIPSKFIGEGLFVNDDKNPIPKYFLHNFLHVTEFNAARRIKSSRVWKAFYDYYYFCNSNRNELFQNSLLRYEKFLYVSVMQEIMNEWRSNFKIHFHIAWCRTTTAIVLILAKRKSFHENFVRCCKIFSSLLIHTLLMINCAQKCLLFYFYPRCESFSVTQERNNWKVFSERSFNFTTTKYRAIVSFIFALLSLIIITE
jgi:hypothetical protein